ncbi:hypothetical protein RSOLAG1IB_05472 [Rhizoctonia solani AG-1 IB]|uniref:Uncharacterized protein n=2 Tax=Thanatephorus cucumeris (strain AG1-IB / isolate 7/3/14) TaxID=1108050 RepID=A0A0B7G0G8_THACB|nr:hypothetical protein RSOLAG1IB_05472 [Rhizoctonia solani AG-1 IB]
MPAFSRLQLAQALLEYDNEDLPPEAPRHSAYESAIFSHLRHARGPPRPNTTVYGDDGPRRSANHLGVELPHDGGAAGTELGAGFRGSVGARRSLDIQSALPTRKSVDVLRSDWGDKRTSKFEASELGYLGTPDEDEDAPEGGMDLSSWGLDKYVAKSDQEKQSKSRQGTSDRRVSVASRSPSDALPNPFARMPTPADNTSPLPERPKHSHRHSDFGAGGAFLDAQSSQDNLTHEALKDRPRSVANPLDLEEYRANGPHIPLEKRRQSTGVLQSETVQFPSTTSPAPLADNNDANLPNPFALPPPTPERLSRFDPKARQSVSELPEGEGDGVSMRTGMMREGTAHLRTYSNASLGSRALLDDFKDDGASYMTGRQLDGPGNKQVSRMELLRPKVLVMPSPLQGSEQQHNQNAGRAGFMLSSDGTPLPPGATPGVRPGVRPLTSAGMSHSGQSMSAGFTPNPRTSMTLSQLTFRNNLMVDGSRDVAYNDIDQQLRRATAEGEQAEQVWDDYDAETEAPQQERPAGRLYGRSLMDDLQDRKAQIHGRQRVFRGDNRPAMMDRGQIRTQSTLIDSAALQSRPVTLLLPHGPVAANTEQRPNNNRASTIQPLLNFDSNEQNRGANSKSVFGVDTLWEKEMEKLRNIQEQQRLDQEDQQAREGEKQRRKIRKAKKGKGKDEAPASPEAGNTVETPAAPELNRLSSAPPTLPNITPLHEQAPPVSPGKSESSLPAVSRRRRSVATLDAGGWFAGSSDGEEEPGAKRDSGPRTVPISRGRDEDSDDDDVPLTNIKVRAPDSDDDEDAPLSNLKPRQSVLLPDLKQTSTLDIAASLGLAPEPTQTKAVEDADSDDEVPLAIRRQTITIPPNSDKKPVTGDGDSDDEKPLGLRLSHAPNIAQQRRQEEYQQMMLMQQQQQLMMQQQAMRASMFNPSISFQPHMGGPGSIHSFGAPMPVQDPKLTRVDRWRHDVSGVDDP